MILAEDAGDIIVALPSEGNDIKCEPHIHTLLLTDENAAGGAVRELNGLIPIAQRAAEHMDTLTAHLGEFCCPKMIPEGIIRCIWEAGIKTHLLQLPAFGMTNRCGEFLHIVVWERITKSLFGRVEEVRPPATRKESSEMYLYAERFSKPDISAV